MTYRNLYLSAHSYMMSAYIALSPFLDGLVLKHTLELLHTQITIEMTSCTNITMRIKRW